ncbi:universal stress protein A-like protein [Curcuma longa]|uniref:universal stress protein A-like protein n=1 Tax=Curcuma longa TaxID=136217 RepID=UPI003D9EC946
MAEGGAGGGRPQKVMVAIDESDCSRYALEWVLANLRPSLSSSPLFVFSVQALPEIAYVTAASLGSPPMELIQAVQKHQKQASDALLEKAKKICAQHGVVVETITDVGDPKEAICQAAEKMNIDLLIVGSHGKNALQRAFLGSVSNYCVHNAKCPVLVVKKAA